MNKLEKKLVTHTKSSAFLLKLSHLIKVHVLLVESS